MKQSDIEKDQRIVLTLVPWALDGTGQDMERVTFFNDLPDYKGSNPVVSDDGKMVAFQAAYAKAAAGVGCGIYLLDLEQWEKQNEN